MASHYFTLNPHFQLYSQLCYHERQGKLQTDHRGTMGKLQLHDWYRQYQKLKAQNPDAILLYRMGDFYEIFDDDAKLVSELLDVTLTRKDYATEKTGKNTQKYFCPMAGMPYHAVENYVARLVGEGYRVAIAEQLSQTAASKSDTRPRSVFASGLEHTERQRGLVHREIVRVLTPGTIIEPGMLPSDRNNYLAAVVTDGEYIGLSYADLSTGEFAATQFSGSRAAAHLESELVRLNVAEILVPDSETLRPAALSPSSARLAHDLAPMTKEEREHLLPHERIARRLEQENTARWAHGSITPSPAWTWDLETARDTLTHHFGVHSLASFGLEDSPLATRAAGAALHYIRDTQRGAIAQFTSLRAYTTGTFMLLDPQTRRNLELLEGNSRTAQGSLVKVLDRTQTPMGKRMLRHWLSQPLLDQDALSQRQTAVATLVEDGLLRAEVRQSLRQVGDMERIVNRIIQGTSVATPRDLASLRQALRALPTIIAAAGHRAELHFTEDTEAYFEMATPPRPAPYPAAPTAPLPAAPIPRPSSTSDDLNIARQQSLDLSIAPEISSSGPAPRVAGDDLFDDDGAVGDMPPSPASQTEEPPPPPPPQTEEPPPPPPPQTDLSSPLPIDPCEDVLAMLEGALDEDPPALLGASNYLRNEDEENGNKPRRFIRPGYDQRIDQIVAASREAQQYIDSLEGQERQRTGIKSLKVDYNKVFGYYIAIPRSYSNQVPANYERKQTLANAERYITAELKEYESVVLNAQQQIVEREREVFFHLCGELSRHCQRLRRTAHALARLDVLASLAEAAVRGRFTRPCLSQDTALHITGGRHPMVEQSFEDLFVPNDTSIDTEKQQILLITGPNMAGKSTILRQVALIVLMAQIGSFVPAESAHIGLVDRIFTRIGAQDDIATGQSTFMVEMTETAALLMQSTRRSLIILDEVGRGTSTYDGMAIARAVVEYLHNEPRLQCRTLFATHYHELIALEEVLPRVKNYHMAAIEQQGRVVFLYEMRRGSADRSYGIHVAELAGIPRPVIHRASELLAELEQRGGQAESRGGEEEEEAKQHSEEAAERTVSSPPSSPASLVDAAPNPVIAYLKQMNINELTPIEAMTRLYELQQLAQTPAETHKP